MPYLLNCVYFLFLLVFSPFLVYKSLTTGKYRRGLWRKFFGLKLQQGADAPRSPDHAPRATPHAPRSCVWFHGVSVGEIHLLRQVVAEFRRKNPDWECVISTTTDTGYDEARKRFPDLCVFYWPLDFSWAVRRTFAAIRPSLVVLAESELWPNFLMTARAEGVPVAVINARMSPRSFRRWNKLRPLSFVLCPLSFVDLWCVQTEEYAECYRSLGVPAERVRVTGSVKYDGVECDRRNSRTQELRRLLGVNEKDLIWIAGSTQAPEEKIVLDIYRRAKETYPNLCLFLVPRQKERFEEVARLLQQSGLPFVRRSRIEDRGSKIVDRGSKTEDRESSILHPPSSILHPPSSVLRPPFSILLVDTIGELGSLWGLADVAYVGGSLDGKRGGQNMIEPAAYGSAVVFGPHVWNFRDTATRLLAASAALQIQDAVELETQILRLLNDAVLRERLGQNAQRLVRQQQGATKRTVEQLERLQDGGNPSRSFSSWKARTASA